MFRHTTSLVISCALISLFVTSSSFAQQPGVPGQPAQNTPEKKEVAGTLAVAKGKYIKLTPEKGGQDWEILVDSKPNEITIRGEAEKGWVRQGMLVTFDATVDKKGIGQQPVSELSVFAPGPSIVMGVTEASSLPTLGSDGGDKGSEEETSKVTVVGRLTSIARDGRWNVAAGRAKVLVEVAEDAKIKVELHEPSLIQIGDKIKGTVWFTNEIQGTMKGEVEIEAAKPFAAPEDPKEARRKGRQKKKEDKETEAPGEAKSIFDM
ncbi:hypothetical protein [Blastopirellula marina]|uniref:Uncharacterized protein n=1 Tax=Blastopirellula marina TaxID=124 RepID=A0A2S8FH57_9BACT|nr:hypothetical protein [Blastopirellula marina]PQO31521.1 hypothetical protein C5Y98_19045 [Blastopirellula marina]PTL42827.1 hypothetical protein C5Y97_19055 [Blastopirellula marina]